VSLQIYYDGSGRDAPLQGGAGFAIFQDAVEVSQGAETIPFGTNNVGEFLGALRGLEGGAGRGESVDVIGDCEILTKAMNEGRMVSDPDLARIQSQIFEAMKKFTKVRFFHVTREFNKRADQIATAASISVEAGRKACADPAWDPRTEKALPTPPIVIVERSERWLTTKDKDLMDGGFPITDKRGRPRDPTSRILQTQLRTFPVNLAKEGARMDRCILSHPISKYLGSKLAPEEKASEPAVSAVERAVESLRKVTGVSFSRVETPLGCRGRGGTIKKAKNKTAGTQVEWVASPCNTQDSRRRLHPTVSAQATPQPADFLPHYSRWHLEGPKKRRKEVHVRVSQPSALAAKGADPKNLSTRKRPRETTMATTSAHSGVKRRRVDRRARSSGGRINSGESSGGGGERGEGERGQESEWGVEDYG
jgi:ribonuclease HI